jgi:nucleoredoxin
VTDQAISIVGKKDRQPPPLVVAIPIGPTMTPKLSSSIGALEVTMFSATAALMVAAKLYYDRNNHHTTTTPQEGRGRGPGLYRRKVSFKVPGECSLLPGTSKPILGVLFAAAWCPDCADVVPAIGRLLDAIPDQSVIEIYYVASDTSESEMHAFVPPSLRVIPFAATDQRADIKRHFQVCAQKEMNDLGLSSRKSGIPTLLLIETATGRILSDAGVDHVMHGKCAESVFRKWAALLDAKDDINNNTTPADDTTTAVPAPSS